MAEIATIFPQLTHFIPEGVILRENGVGISSSSSSDKPVHIGVPAVHKATEMIFFKVTFWQKSGFWNQQDLGSNPSLGI